MPNQHIINEFLNKYDYWANANKKWLSNHIKNTNALLKKFLSIYPLNKVENLEIDEYVVGKGTNSTFCWWIESELNELGDIRGGQLTAFQRFGIYYDKAKKDYSFGSKVTRKTRFGSTNEEVYENVRKSIVSLINAIINNDYESIVKNELNPLFKNKITYLYNSENWLPTYSDNDLNIMLSVLEIPFDKEIDRVYKRKLLFDFYKSLNRPDITTLSFMDFIYSDLGYRPALRNYDAINLNDKKVKKYTLVKVNTIEEMVSQNKGKKHGLVIEKPETQVEKKMVGKKGEEIVKQYLNDHKKELNIIGDIDCACEYDDSLHYDFSYKNNLGQTIYIESKATKSNRNQNIVFEMSDGEYDFMKNNENNYYVFFINDIYNGTIIKEISASLIVGHPIKYRISITDISK